MSTEMNAAFDRWALHEYTPPKWAKKLLEYCPEHRLKVTDDD